MSTFALSIYSFLLGWNLYGLCDSLLLGRTGWAAGQAIAACICGFAVSRLSSSAGTKGGGE